MAEQELTFAQTFGGSRDACCAAAIGNMAAMGRFEQEFAVYGCASLEAGEITCRVSPEADEIYQFVADSVYQGSYPTGVSSYRCSSSVPSGMREQIARETKLELARRMLQVYPREYFTLLASFSSTEPSDGALPLLKQMANEMDGHFDEKELQLLEGTIGLACESKQLKKESRQMLQQWVKKTRKQMEDDPQIQTEISRTFYGFCYQEKGIIKPVVNAQPILVREQQARAKQRGYLTGPMLKETVWFENAMEIADGRERFREQLKALQDEQYFHLLQQMKALPSVIDGAAFEQALQQLEESGASQQAIDDFRGYGYRWGCL